MRTRRGLLGSNKMTPVKDSLSVRAEMQHVGKVSSTSTFKDKTGSSDSDGSVSQPLKKRHPSSRNKSNNSNANPLQEDPNPTSRPKRRIAAPKRWLDIIEDPGEQWERRKKTVKSALSTKTQKTIKLAPPLNPVDTDIPLAPTFFPSLEEFKDPLRYIESIRLLAQGYGIAKIVPPEGWNPPQPDASFHENKVLPTKRQALHRLREADEVYEDGKDYKILSYLTMANQFADSWARRVPGSGGRSKRKRCNSSFRTAQTNGPNIGVGSTIQRAGPRAPKVLQYHSPTLSGLNSQSGMSSMSASPGGMAKVKKEELVMPVDLNFGVVDEKGSWEGGFFVPDLQAKAKDPQKEEEERSRRQKLEREYWDVIDGSEECVVDYANDLDTSVYWSGFIRPPRGYMSGEFFDRDAPVRLSDPTYYRTCGWNLNNLAFWPGSVLRWYRTHVNGLTAPWLYLGMQFATFAWHNEDNYLYSLNYHHWGEPKQWYGVPGSKAGVFERCVAKMLGENLADAKDILYNITKMMSPTKLMEGKVPVCKLLQEEGQYVVTFPKAYHSGFSYGFNCGEAVNFAIPDWIPYSRESMEAYRQVSRTSALSHEKMVILLTMYMPDHSLHGCELVLKELERIRDEEVQNRAKLEKRGVMDPAKTGGQALPTFSLGLIDQQDEAYDERRVCKVCSHTLYMTGVACDCNSADVVCLRCADDLCDCPMDKHFLLSWWRETDMEHVVRTARAYLACLEAGTATLEDVAHFRKTINPFTRVY